MTFQTVFKRYELKYLLTKEQKKRILIKTAPHMSIDQYGKTEIRNIYFDTDNYRLVRRSIERPAYKEKLRIRSYRRAEPDSTVFVELKKKYNNIVYKRRLPLTETDALKWLLGEENCREERGDACGEARAKAADAGTGAGGSGGEVPRRTHIGSKGAPDQAWCR